MTANEGTILPDTDYGRRLFAAVHELRRAGARDVHVFHLRLHPSTWEDMVIRATGASGWQASFDLGPSPRAYGFAVVEDLAIEPGQLVLRYEVVA